MDRRQVAGVHATSTLDNFFVAHWMCAGELRIVYCPTKEMLGDFFTKPLQGHQFTVLRSMIMDHPLLTGLNAHSVGPQECVEDSSHVTEHSKQSVTNDTSHGLEDGKVAVNNVAEEWHLPLDVAEAWNMHPSSTLQPMAQTTSFVT